jgi:hypothetical protein
LSFDFIYLFIFLEDHPWYLESYGAVIAECVRASPLAIGGNFALNSS